MRIVEVSRSQPKVGTQKENQPVQEFSSVLDKAMAKNGVWEEIASQYDVRNMTFEELKVVAHRLHDAGEISFFHLALLTFNPENHPTDPISNYFLTKTDNLGRRDWVEEYRARLDRNSKLGNTTGIDHTRELLTILTRLA